MKNNLIPAEYESIEAHIRRARIERSVVVAQLLADGGVALGRGVARLARALLGGVGAACDARSVESHALMHRMVIR